MAIPTTLDPRDARPLTSREISRVLDGIASSASASSCPRDLVSAAVDATVSTLRGWCTPSDVDTALAQGADLRGCAMG